MKKTNILFTVLWGMFTLVLLQPQALRASCCLDSGKIKQNVEKFTPVIVQGEEIPAPPEAILYRAVTSADCSTLTVAYHIVWPYEQDPRPGFWPSVTRATYTGGLKLQRVIYGPGDVEFIELTIDLKSQKIIKAHYETAEYDAKGSVIHVHVYLEADKIPAYAPLIFKVSSWNHLFELLPGAQAVDKQTYKFTPQPFTAEKWKYYKMTKKKSSLIGLDRSHPDWEDKEICPFE